MDTTPTVAELAEQVAVLQRREALREQGMSAMPSHADWLQSIQERQLRAFIERRERARRVVEAKEHANASVHADRERHEARLAKHRADRQTKLERLRRPILDEFTTERRRLERSRDRKLSEGQRHREQIEREYAAKVAHDEAALKQLDEYVAATIEVARAGPLEIQLTPAQATPAPRDASLVKDAERDDWHVEPSGKRLVGVRSEGWWRAREEGRTRKMLGGDK
jgi:hypothetical protein